MVDAMIDAQKSGLFVMERPVFFIAVLLELGFFSVMLMMFHNIRRFH